MRRAINSLCLLLIPLSASADAWDDLSQSISSWEQSDAREEEERRWEEEDRIFESASALFPEQEKVEEDEGVLDRLRESRIGEFLSVRIGGQDIIFRDVPRKEWFAPFVRSSIEAGIFSGYRDVEGRLTGEFKPANAISVAELSKIAVMLSGQDPSACPAQPQNLTASGSWSASFVSCAEQKGWAVFSDGSVDVSRSATRAEVTVTLLQARNIVFGERMGTVFADVTAEVVFGSAIEQAYKDGIISGYTDDAGNPTGFFKPDNPIIRAEAAKIVVNVMQVYGE